jgi:two-component system OmpR family response regulator
MRILIIEDDPALSLQIEDALTSSNYIVDLADNGEEGWFLGQTEPYDAVILDLGLPRMDGLIILEKWRQEGLAMPVMVLSARCSWRERVLGLRTGADDYLSKPFVMEELVARLQTLIRRATGHVLSILTCGPVELELYSRQVLVNCKPVKLTALEFRALSYLMHYQGKIISKTELTEHIYDQHFDFDSNVIEVLINHLRKKLGKDLIRTHRGMGYQIIADDMP